VETLLICNPSLGVDADNAADDRADAIGANYQVVAGSNSVLECDGVRF